MPARGSPRPAAPRGKTCRPSAGRWLRCVGTQTSEIAQELVIVTDQAAPDEVDAALRGALLTDEEMAAGLETWRTYPDPFGEWHEEPCEDTDLDPEKRDATASNRKDDSK
jgi:hypothetical protein